MGSTRAGSTAAFVAGAEARSRNGAKSQNPPGRAAQKLATLAPVAKLEGRDARVASA